MVQYLSYHMLSTTSMYIYLLSVSNIQSNTLSSTLLDKGNSNMVPDAKQHYRPTKECPVRLRLWLAFRLELSPSCVFAV